MPQRHENTAPSANALMQPSGEARNSSESDIRRVVSNTGAGCTVSSIGVTAIDTATLMITNSS